MLRRPLLAAGLAWPWLIHADDSLLPRLRAGGCVVAFRHASAPGTYDPPGMKLGDCSTQRNLGEGGRAQARRLGAWFAERRLAPARIRTSPWCRCVDTAQLAFGQAETWAALGSPRAGTEETNAASLAELRAALAAAAGQPGRFEVWVTHMFVLNDLTGAGTASGEGLLLDLTPGGAPRVLGRLVVA